MFCSTTSLPIKSGWRNYFSKTKDFFGCLPLLSLSAPNSILQTSASNRVNATQQGNSQNASTKKTYVRAYPRPWRPCSTHLKAIFRTFTATFSTCWSTWLLSASGSTSFLSPSSGGVQTFVTRIFHTLNVFVYKISSRSYYQDLFEQVCIRQVPRRVPQPVPHPEGKVRFILQADQVRLIREGFNKNIARGTTDPGYRVYNFWTTLNLYSL